MKTIKYISKLLLGIVILSLVSCEEDFLQSDFERLVSIKKVADYNALLNDENLTTRGNFLAILEAGAPSYYLSDDFFPTNLNAFSASSYQAYAWREQLYAPGESPGAWTLPYNAIYTYNTILNEIDEAVDANTQEDQIQQIKAEALLGRAFEHLFLVNLFAQPYSAQTTTTPGIPYVYNADITQPIPGRETLDATYAKIEADILEALPNLSDLPTDNTRGSKIAAYGVLARMHLYKQEFTKSLEFLNLALDIRSDYIDYNTLFQTPFSPTESTDHLYVRTNPVGDIDFTFDMSEDLFALFPEVFGGQFDTRIALYFLDFNALGEPGHTTPTVIDGFNFSERGITMQELILTKAEILARQNNLEEALSILNEFRRNRLQLYDFFFSDLVSTDSEEVLTWVLDERRKEFMTFSTRFLDMRRLQLEGRIGTVTHVLRDADGVATLPEGSPRYTLQIPQEVINFNPEMEQNQ